MNAGHPAFGFSPQQSGLNQREYIAVFAMHALLSRRDMAPDQAAKESRAFADAMMSEFADKEVNVRMGPKH